ncbi:MAG: HNH endonuclease [Sphingomonadales bacterium]|nr:HNH endonuclease [Sphingomonadales bacterium]MDE2171190.1 HNH endonuclease [Sphingomonadales bacterium]
MALRIMKTGLASFNGKRLVTPPKRAASIYQTPEYRAWREAVIARAGRQCEAVERGLRCTKAEPHHRMFADHRVELRDGGAEFDPSNGQCLCGAHHTAKTAKARADRRHG